MLFGCSQVTGKQKAFTHALGLQLGKPLGLSVQAGKRFQNDVAQSGPGFTNTAQPGKVLS